MAVKAVQCTGGYRCYGKCSAVHCAELLRPVLNTGVVICLYLITSLWFLLQLMC